MALKTKAIRALNAEDREKTLHDTRTELMHQRGLAAMGGAVKNPGQIRDLRTTIARILTIEHQLGEEYGSAPLAKPGRAPPKAAKPPAKEAPKAKAKAPAKPAKAPAKTPPKAAKAAGPKAAPAKKSGGA